MNSLRSSVAHSMSRYRRPVSKKSSPLLRGNSICQQLQISSFGGFHAAVHDIKSYLPMVEFKLPTVIVVGGRSAGKSSLLENITKCAIFPRDSALCTKMPVKLQLNQVAKESDSSVTIIWRGNVYPLQSKDNILQEVGKIMDSVDSIVTDEITVKISQVWFTACPCNGNRKPGNCANCPSVLHLPHTFFTGNSSSDPPCCFAIQAYHPVNVMAHSPISLFGCHLTQAGL